MLSQIRWHQANGEANPFEYLNSLRKGIHWWNGRQMNRYIDNELTKRYSDYKADREGKRNKSIIDLVFRGYLAERQDPKSKTSPDELDPGFRAFAINQIRLFVFAGHDSASSTICCKELPFHRPFPSLYSIPSSLQVLVRVTDGLYTCKAYALHFSKHPIIKPLTIQ